MKNKISLIIVFSVIFSGCTAFNNPFKKETVTLTSFCNLDLDKRIKLERMSFRLPKAISSLEPCQAGKMMHDLTRDHKDFFTRFFSFKNNVYTSLGTLELRAEGDLFILGAKVEAPDEWLVRQKQMWKSSYRHDRPVRRKIKRVKLNGMECIKINRTHHIRKYSGDKKLPDKPELSSYYIEYVCWDASAEKYPPITISAGVGYAKGKTTFPYDIDKDILLPVFNSLTLKKISNESMKARLEVYREKQVDNCKRIYDSVNYSKRNNKYELVSDVLLRKMKKCGYKTDIIRTWWCKETINDSRRDESKSQYRAYPKSKIENLKNCQK